MIKKVIFVPIYEQNVELYYGIHKELRKVNDHYRLDKLNESSHTRCGFVWKYDNGNVNCSVIAKQLGGGGHIGAAGMVVDDMSIATLLNLIIK